MKILHYSLGLPPYRSGGLTKYATDLVQSQKSKGDTVSLLFPGDYTFWKKPTMKIVQEPSSFGVAIFELKNPTPVPLLHGVKNPSDIYKPSQKISNQDLEFFYNLIQPEVFHIHTLMGLPLELVVFLKEKGVKIILTSHDYYGLCPKVNFINEKKEICDTPNGKNCAICNSTSSSSLFLRLRNSKYVLKHKDKFNKGVQNKIKEAEITTTSALPTRKEINEYEALLEYYNQYYKQIDCIHFNSEVTKQVYQNFITPNQSVVIPITHKGIKDHRKVKVFNASHIRFGFIGDTSQYKGFPMLKKALCELEKTGVTNWSLNVWGGAVGIDEDCNKIEYKGKYEAGYLRVVFDQMDVLIVPSLWKETFSLITLEAVSYGIPVLVSSNVGAKDIVKEYDSNFICAPNSNDFFQKLLFLLKDKTILETYNERICSGEFNYSLDDHETMVKELYINLLKER
jgi:glycosyltransferase involved in cell wall biosynthesis